MHSPAIISVQQTYYYSKHGHDVEVIIQLILQYNKTQHMTEVHGTGKEQMENKNHWETS